MQRTYYSEFDYWQKYLDFLPSRYQETYTPPSEAYWQWKAEEVHYDYVCKDSNKASVILIHGAGGNGRILGILMHYLAHHCINYYAPDNLGYGLTRVHNRRFDYSDWVNMLSDFARFVAAKDNNPIVLIGMSIGGMMAYQVAAAVAEVSGVIVTTLADPRDQDTMIAMAKNRFLGTRGLQLAHVFKPITDHIWLPIRWLCKLDLMSRNYSFTKIFMEDRYAGGVNISLRFLRTFSAYTPAVAFEDFNTCPILLLHPEKDDWTPFELSQKVFNKLSVDKELHVLEECGHAPIEEPGISAMQAHILNFVKGVASATP